MPNPIAFPSLPTLNRFAERLAGSGAVDIDDLFLIPRCAAELAGLPPDERRDIEERGLIRDGAEELVQILKVLAEGSEQRQVELVVPAGAGTWRFLARSDASSCDFDTECDDPCADEDETYELLAGQRGCCTKGTSLPADPMRIKAFTLRTRELLGRDGDVSISVNPRSFDGCGHLTQPDRPPVA